jgi:hypothetical protein
MKSLKSKEKNICVIPYGMPRIRRNLLKDLKLSLSEYTERIAWVYENPFVFRAAHKKLIVK